MPTQKQNKQTKKKEAWKPHIVYVWHTDTCGGSMDDKKLSFNFSIFENTNVNHKHTSN